MPYGPLGLGPVTTLGGSHLELRLGIPVPLHRGEAPARHPHDVGAAHHGVLPAPRRSGRSRQRGVRRSAQRGGTRRPARGARPEPSAVRAVPRVPGPGGPLQLRHHRLRQPPGHRRDPRPGRRDADPHHRGVPVRPADRPPAGPPVRPLPRHVRRRRHPDLRRGHLRRADLLGRHHVRADRGQAVPRLAHLRHRRPRSRSSPSSPRPTSCWSTRSSRATAPPRRTCSSTTCCRA